MVTTQSGLKDVDAYIAGFPREVQELLEKVRTTIRAAAPDADEAMKYGVPTFIWNGNLVHYAAFKEHIGFYPTPGAIETFKEELAAYESAKGSVRFPFDKPLPLELIGRIVKFRLKENLDRAQAKRKKR
jgi:uncharacterized protein YdhG (YjbR/CyaY superfamily)